MVLYAHRAPRKFVRPSLDIIAHLFLKDHAHRKALAIHLVAYGILSNDIPLYDTWRKVCIAPRS